MAEQLRTKVWVIRFLIAATLVALASPAAADPIFTPLILGALGGAAGIFGSATTLVASLVSALVVTPIGRGVLIL